MKFLVISDIHGSADYMEKALEAYTRHKPDQILLLGDILYHGPRNPLPQGYNPQKVAALLNPLADKIIAVRGNCDAEVDQMLLNFDIQRDCATLFLGGHRITATHGHRFPLDPPPHSFPGDIYLFGHIHVPVIRQENGITLLNPGSITLPKQNSPHTYGLLDENGFTIMTEDHEVYQSLTF